MASAVADPERIAIRRARPGDASSVRALVRQLGYEPQDRSFDETFAQVARHPESVVFMACRGVQLVGYLAMSHRPQIRLGGRVAYIDELVVDSSTRGHGIGGELLNQALVHAKGLGCVRVEVLCGTARDAYKRGFYAARGLTEIETAVYRLDLSGTR